MDYPEKLAILGIQDTGRRKKNQQKTNNKKTKQNTTQKTKKMSNTSRTPPKTEDEQHGVTDPTTKPE